MPTYPTRKPVSRPSGRNHRDIGWPRRDNQRRGRPTPANDNDIRRPVPKPANDNDVRRPPPGGKARPVPQPRPRFFMPPGLGYARFATDRIIDWYRKPNWDRGGPVPVAPYGRYVYYHGPNIYPEPYIGTGEIWNPGYSDGGAPGPQTGLIGGQAMGVYSSFQDVIDKAFPWYVGWWQLSSYGSGHGAQIEAWKWLYPDQPLPDGAKELDGFTPVPIPIPSPKTRHKVAPWQQPFHIPVLPNVVPHPGQAWPDPLPQFNPVPAEFPFVISPTPNPNMIPGRSPAFGPGAAPAPSPRPSLVPNVFSLSQSPGRAAQPSRAYHGLRPPRRGEREPPKGRLQRAAWAIAGALGAGTEALDAIGAAHKALPPQFRARAKWHNGQPVPPSMKRKMDAVWRNYDKIDPNAFMRELVWDQIEDQVLGRVSDKVDQGIGNRVGVSRSSRVIDLQPVQDMLNTFRDWSGT